MEDATFEKLITLYIIRYLDNTSSAYKIVKILSWKFGIIHFGRISKALVKEKYLVEKVINQMEHYTLTLNGELFLKEHLDELRQELKEKYLPNDPEYIQVIISRSDK